MKRFKNILVAVDVTAVSSHPAGRLSTELLSLFEGAQRICQESRGRVTLMSVLPRGSGMDDLVLEAASSRLAEMAAAHLPGLQVEILPVLGKPVLEIVRQVLRGKHEVLCLAARPKLAGQGIVGSTATQLIRKCPCPVWVVSRKPKPIGPRVVLSAVSLDAPASEVLDLSAALVGLRGGEWHVLHVPEYPLEGGMRLRGAPTHEVAAYEKECRGRPSLSCTPWRTLWPKPVE